MSTDPAGPYRVSFQRAARERIQRCALAAIQLGIAGDYAAVLRTMLDRLAKSPLAWGDPRRRLKAAKLVVRVRLHERLLVEYAVHEEQRVVFVRDCKPVLGHPLESFA